MRWTSVTTAWDTLRLKYPWPEERPFANDIWASRGWMSEGTSRMLREMIPAGSTVLELGSWLGLSTRFILSECKASRIVSVDTWDGRGVSKEATALEPSVLEVLYPLFITRCWAFRNRIIPLRADFASGVNELLLCGFLPDVIYLDGSHDYENAKSDIQLCLNSFPQATLVGDDWGMEGVAKAAVEVRETGRVSFRENGRAWTMKLN